MHYNLATLFYDISDQNRNRPAIRYNQRVYNYRELNIISNKIANFLLDRGVSSYDVVAILGTKTVFNYAIMLACLKIGAIYTNIDIENPTQRIDKIIDICKPKILISDTEISLSPNILKIDFEIISSYSDNNLEISSNITGNNPAYIMFTSGSTGTPKGVTVSHLNILNFLHWSINRYGITPYDVFAQVSPLYFDNSVFDFYTALFSGASLVPIKKTLLTEPIALVNYIDKHKCTILFSVPSLLVYLLTMRVLQKDNLKAIRIISFGGEGFPKTELKKLYDLYSDRVKFINVYGPTEGTCICSSYDISLKEFENLQTLAPLGVINPNFRYYIVDENLKEVEVGRKGELIIAGPNVSLGYYNDIDRTKESFIQNPFITTHRDIVYKTGDIVYEKDGLLYFVGRVDNQIKHMGYRIELEEIENVINSIDNVAQCGVIYHRKVNSNYGKIVAFIQVENSLTLEYIKSILTQKLPPYMLPNKIIILDELPKNQNGKIDRRKLQEMV